MPPTKLTTICGIVALAFTAHTIKADTFSQTYTGTIGDPSIVVQENFALMSASSLLLTTTSYGGGQNVNGTSSAPGGFQPSVTLYTSTGVYVASQQINSPVAMADPSTGLSLDAYLQRPLLAGSYIVTLTNWSTQQPPTATNLSDGFVNYGSSTFKDASGANRTGNYSLNLAVNSAATATPEPSTQQTAFVGLAAVILLSGLHQARKRRSNETARGAGV